MQDLGKMMSCRPEVAAAMKGVERPPCLLVLPVLTSSSALDEATSSRSDKQWLPYGGREVCVTTTRLFICSQ